MFSRLGIPQIDRANGTLVNMGNFWRVYVFSTQDLSASPDTVGVTCVNPSDEPENRTYYKDFYQTKILVGWVELMPDGSQKLHGDVEVARQVIDWENPLSVPFGVTGYTAIGAIGQEWGVTQAEYENACTGYLDSMIRAVQQARPNAVICLSDGGSELGIDKVVGGVAHMRSLRLLRHSCPNFLIYVHDVAGQAVLVAPTQALYSDTFIANLRGLASMGGRLQAFRHDINAALLLGVRLIPVHLMPFLCGRADPDRYLQFENKIDDATARLLRIVRFPGYHPFTHPDELRRWVVQTTLETVDAVLSGRRMDIYSDWSVAPLLIA